MKQLKQSPVAKIIAWILITVSALMLLAGTAGAYAISELGFYTRRDRKSTRLNSSHANESRMPSSA